MNAYLVAAAALVAALAPSLAVAVRARPIEGAVALQLAGTTTTLALLCLAAGFHASTYFVVAVIAAALMPVSAFVLARMLGHDV